MKEDELDIPQSRVPPRLPRLPPEPPTYLDHVLWGIEAKNVAALERRIIEARYEETEPFLATRFRVAKGWAEIFTIHRLEIGRSILSTGPVYADIFEEERFHVVVFPSELVKFEIENRSPMPAWFDAVIIGARARP